MVEIIILDLQNHSEPFVVPVILFKASVCPFQTFRTHRSPTRRRSFGFWSWDFGLDLGLWILCLDCCFVTIWDFENDCHFRSGTYYFGFLDFGFLGLILGFRV